MNKVQAKRMLKWADHIEKGKLGHERFDMRWLHRSGAYTLDGFCGTVGCALGELPVIFPRLFRFVGNGVRKIKDDWFVFAALKEHFDITQGEANCLFDRSPTFRNQERKEQQWSDREFFPASILSCSNSRESIAGSMHRFVEWKMKGEHADK